MDIIEEKIIQYVNDNPGCSKSDVVRSLKDEHVASRLTTLAHIDRLEIKGILKTELERPNSQIYKIYINKNNKLVSILTELEEFRRAYSILLIELARIINSKDYSKDAKVLGIKDPNPNSWTYEDRQRYTELEVSRLKKVNVDFAAADKAVASVIRLWNEPKLLAAVEPLKRKKIGSEVKPILTKLGDVIGGYRENSYFIINSSVELFYVVVDLMFYRGMIAWPEEIDKELLSQVYSTVYSKISEIQLILLDFIKAIKVAALDPIKVIIDGRKKFRDIPLEIIISCYHKLGLSKAANKIADIIIKMNQDIDRRGVGLIKLDPYILAAANSPDRISDLITKHIEESMSYHSSSPSS